MLKPTKDTRPQIDRFKEAARQLGVDEREDAFDEKLKAIAKRKLKDEPKALLSPNGKKRGS